jgi:gamma-tubulin complex component 3
LNLKCPELLFDLPFAHPQGVITGVTEASQRYDSTEVLSRILRRIKEYGIAFSDRTFAIVAALSSHPEQDCRFLAIRLSFNDFYKPKKDSARP